MQDGGIACRLRWELGYHSCCKIMRKAMPRQVAKCGRRSSAVARAIGNADIEKGAAQPLRLPSVGRSLNSRGFSSPRYSAHRAKAV